MFISFGGGLRIYTKAGSHCEPSGPYIHVYIRVRFNFYVNYLLPLFPSKLLRLLSTKKDVSNSNRTIQSSPPLLIIGQSSVRYIMSIPFIYIEKNRKLLEVSLGSTSSSFAEWKTRTEASWQAANEFAVTVYGEGDEKHRHPPVLLLFLLVADDERLCFALP